MIVTHIDGRSEYLTDYKSLERRRRVNGEYSLSFVLIKTERNEHSFPLAVEESLIDYDGQQYRIKQMTEINIGLTPIKQIKADHVFFDLVDEFQYETISGTKTLQACLNHALQAQGWTFDVIDAFSSVLFENFGNDNVLALIQICLERFGAEVEINGNHLTFKKQVGRVTDNQFRYGYNIKTIEKTVDTSNLSTYIKGFGKDVSADYTSPNAHLYPKLKHAKPVYDERYTTKEGLLERLIQEIQDEPIVSIKVDAVEMKKAGVDTENIEFADRLFVIYEPLNVDINARIVELIEYPEEPTPNQYTIANARKNITDVVADFQRTKDRVDGIFEGKEKLPFNALDEAVQRSTQALQSAQTELKFEGGILAIDPREPDNLVVFNSNGIGISRNGGATFTEAITVNGFNLSVGAIGQLDANNINANTLSAITARLGDVEAGSLTGVTIQTSTNPNVDRIVMTETDFEAYRGDKKLSMTTASFFDAPSLRFDNEYTNGNLGVRSDVEITLVNQILHIVARAGMGISVDSPGDFRVQDGNVEIWNDFSVLGTKNASVPTSVGLVNVSAYETAEYYFGDIGRGEVVNGICTIEIESLFKETVNTNIDYEVFLTKYGKGDIYVDEMTPDYFVIKGDDIPFAYEIKAKRKGYETVRLELTHESEVS